MGGLELRPYQELDKQILIQNPQMLIFNEQRTGKTPTSIRACVEAGDTKVLIVCPASMVPVWVEEFQLWSGLSCTAYKGTEKKRDKILSEWEHGLVISYDMFKQTKTRDGAINKILKCKPDAVIVDEAHRGKNNKTANFKALKKLRHIPRRHFMTGTPAPNHPKEVWPLLHFAYHKEFSSKWDFIYTYFDMDEVWVSKVTREKTGEATQQVPGAFKAGMEKQFQLMLSNHSIMRKRKDVMPWLPEREEPIRVRLPLAQDQTRYCRELLEYFETDSVITQGHIDRTIRLRQICQAPELVGLKGRSPKLDWLKEYSVDYQDTPTVVFSRFTGFLHLVKKKLENSYYRVGLICGDTPKDERKKLVDQFQSKYLNMLLIQIDAGKEGLTLDMGEAIIFTDMSPPGGDILQAQDRIVATRPDRAQIPKRIIELVMADAYDEYLVDITRGKIKFASTANDYIQYIRQGGR